MGLLHLGTATTLELKHQQSQNLGAQLKLFAPKQQQDQEQQTQRKCHLQNTHNEQYQSQQLTKRINHLQQIPKQQTSNQQQQQLLLQHQHRLQKAPHNCDQNAPRQLQKQHEQEQPPQQQQQQKLDYKNFSQSTHLPAPNHHRWHHCTWTAINVSNEISCSTATTKINKHTVTIAKTKTTTPTKLKIAAMLKTPKSIAAVVQHFAWLWLICLLSLTHVTTATSVTQRAKSATTTILLPHAITAATTAAVMVASTTTSAASAIVVVGNGVGGGAAATTYQPLAHYQYPPPRLQRINIEADIVDETEVEPLSEEVDEEAEAERALNALNSNEQQLLAYYRRAQYKQQQQHQQQQHHHRRAAAIVTMPAVEPEPEQLVDFDDIVPTAGVVSTLSADELSHGKRHVTKRSATTNTASATTASMLATPTAASTAAIAGSETTTAEEEKCEAKVLDELPQEPFYDFSEIAEDAARKFTEFLADNTPANAISISDQLRERVRQKANSIASEALHEDDNLLAFAIAAPSIHTVVLKFRDNVTIPPSQVHNKAFLGSYWRELSYAWNSSVGAQEWGAPFRDCNLLKGRWLWPFRISFTDDKIKIVAAAFIAADMDACNDGLEEVFGRRHGCDRNTTFCLLTESTNATRGLYTCICREGFYLPNSTLQGFLSDVVEMSEGYDNYSCIPCPMGCNSCDEHGVCRSGEPQEVVSTESLLKVSVGSVLGACILCCIVLSVIVFQQRKCKAIASGMWTVLETILLGIVLLYASVAVHFFPASTERCLIEPWLRELGFITCYGAIILKLYRHLVDFRTRKAHRWVLRDVDLLKYLGTMVFAVVCYMAAFTASAQDLLETAQLESLRELSTNTCLPLKWEFVTQASEVLILCFGLHLAFASRNANTQFRERQFLVATMVLEFLVSTSFYALRFFYLPEMSPGAILLALFLRSQLTNSIALGLIFVPKLWYSHKQVPLPMNLSIRLPVDAFKVNDPQRLGGGYAGLCLGDPDIGELTISEMSPEDIRAELKRLYTQLEILKNKTLRQDNPHISKRRGGRKAGHRRFSLQKKGSKDKALSAKHRNKHHQDIEITEAEPSRTPEDSVCSVEGPTDAEISGISHSMYSHSMVSHSAVSHSTK